MRYSEQSKMREGVTIGGYSLSIRKDEQLTLQQEATRRGVSIKDLLKQSLERRLERIRGGVTR